jgi:membrane protein DedA with SNARE-associated domain
MDSIQAYGPWSVFLGVIIESVIIPIPSPLVIMGAGFLLIHPDLNAWEALGPVLALIVLPGSVASTLGAYIGYGIGYLGGKPLLRRFERFLGFGWRDVEALEKHFHSGRVNVLIFFLRALPIFPLSLISAAAGLIRLPLKRFSFWTFCGTIPRCLFLGYLGWWIGETYRHVAFGIDNAETLVSIILIVAILALNFWIRARVRKRVLKRGSE